MALIVSVYDEVTSADGTKFWYNRNTGTSSWTKPSLLGTYDLAAAKRELEAAEDRARAQYVRGLKRQGRRARRRAAQLDELIERS